jgi:molecular chaperone GrpE
MTDPDFDRSEAAEDAQVSEAAEAGAGGEPEGVTAGAEAEGAALGGLDERVERDIEQIVSERDEYLDSLRRLQADFDNFRKRAMRQQTELLERGSETLIVQLLPVLDALDLAEAHAAKSDDSETALAQIGTLLKDTLVRQGLERIDAMGVAFDPNVHDAVAHEASEEAQDGGGLTPEGDGGEQDPGGGAGVATIAEVMRAGYSLKGRVLRPAMVRVRG